MSIGTPNPRKPWLAALASLLLPGWGQLYNGQLNRAIWHFLVFASLWVGGVVPVALYLPPSWVVPALALGVLTLLGWWLHSIVQAWKTARNGTGTGTRGYLWQISGVYALVFITCHGIALPLLSGHVRTHQVESFHVPSSSMEPTVLADEFIFTDKRYNCGGCWQGVQRGDIAVFPYPRDRSMFYIKRVIGLPGDHVQIKHQKVWINGTPLQHTPANPDNGLVTEQSGTQQWQVQWRMQWHPPDLPTSTAPELAAEIDTTVPNGQVFVMGDNRSNSLDSRTFGTVPLNDIQAKARQVWFSSSPQGVRWERLGVLLY